MSRATRQSWSCTARIDRVVRLLVKDRYRSSHSDTKFRQVHNKVHWVGFQWRFARLNQSRRPWLAVWPWCRSALYANFCMGIISLPRFASPDIRTRIPAYNLTKAKPLEIPLVLQTAYAELLDRGPSAYLVISRRREASSRRLSEAGATGIFRTRRTKVAPSATSVLKRLPCWNASRATSWCGRGTKTCARWLRPSPDRRCCPDRRSHVATLWRPWQRPEYSVCMACWSGRWPARPIPPCWANGFPPRLCRRTKWTSHTSPICR